LKPLEGRSSGFRINRRRRPSQPGGQWHGLRVVPGYSDGLAPDFHRFPAVSAAISMMSACVHRPESMRALSLGLCPMRASPEVTLDDDVPSS